MPNVDRLLFSLPWLLLLVLITLGHFFAVIDDGSSSAISLIFRFVLVPAASILSILFILNYSPKRSNRSLEKLLTTKTLVTLNFIYLITMTGLKINKYWSGNYDYFDAGFYANKIWRISQANIYEALSISSLEGHFQPIILLYALIFKISNSLELVFFMETVALSGSSFLVFSLAKVNGCKGSHSIAFSLVPLVSPLVAFNDILGFHPDHLVLPLTIFAFYCSDKNCIQRSLLAISCLIMIGEQWIPLAMFFGLYIALTKKEKILGLVFSCSMFLIFVIILWKILPLGESINTASSLLSDKSPYRPNLLMNDSFHYFTELLDHRKLFYIGFLFLPFLLFLSPSMPSLITLIPELSKALLSFEPLHFSVDGHYTLGVFAILLKSSIDGFQDNNSVLKTKVTLHPFIIVFSSLALSISHGPMPWSINFASKWSNEAFNYSKYIERPMPKKALEIIDYINKDSTLKLQITNNAFFPGMENHISLKLYPEGDWKKFDYIIALSHPQGSGSELGQLSYNNLLNRTKLEIGCCFQNLFESPQLVILENKSLNDKSNYEE